MYNVEKYIGECLDSILAQTFTNFELIVVDDCSTDNSAAIVESYVPKFGGRLKFTRMKENSGNAALPRNKGLMFSRGEYVYFMDADDKITQTALAELYGLAKKFDADVVYGERHFEIFNDNNVRVVGYQNGKLVTQPTFDSENMADRLKDLLKRDIWGPPWNELVRREILVENEIIFPEVRPGDDHIWILHLFFTAKKFLRVPNITYYWRKNDESITRGQKNLQKKATLWLNAAISGLKYLDKILSHIEFFKTNPKNHHAVLNYFTDRQFRMSFVSCLQLPPFEIYNTIKQEFGTKLGDCDVLVASLCTLINTQQRNLFGNAKKFQQFAARAKKRIAELESMINTQRKVNAENFQRFQQFATQAKKRIAELESH